MAEASKQLMNLVARMDGGNPREAALAREELEQMGPLAVTRLIAELQKTPSAGKKVSMLLLGARIVLLPLLLAGVVIAAVLALVVATDGAGCIGDVGCMGDWFGGGSNWNLREQYHERLHNRQWNQIARALAQLNDTRVVGPLAEALDYADTSTRPALMAAIHRLMPQLDSDTARALTIGQRSALYHLLEEGQNHRGARDADLSVALLRIPILAEDAQALGVVERVAAAAVIPEVAQAAAQTAEQLRGIAQRLQVSQSLLRGSIAPTTAPDMLLRPAQGNSNPQQPQQLLRAVVSNPPPENPDTKETP